MRRKDVNLDYVLKNIGQLGRVKDLTLVRGYHQIFEQYPGLHPDGFDEMDSGWPKELKPICSEMWRRSEIQTSSVKLDQMYYINKAFRKLMSDSARKHSGQRISTREKSVQA